MDTPGWKTYELVDAVFQHGAHAAIVNQIAEGSTVLDVGCAQGSLALMLAGRADVWGVEGNPSAIGVAKLHCKDVYEADLNLRDSVPPIDQLFDVVVFADVLEHVLDSRRVLREYSAFVKPEGVIIVSLPNIAHWRIRAKLLMGNFDYTEYGIMDDTHLRFFTFRTGRLLVEKAGLFVSNIVGVGYSRRLASFDRAVQILAPWFSQQMLIIASPREGFIG